MDILEVMKARHMCGSIAEKSSLHWSVSATGKAV